MDPRRRGLVALLAASAAAGPALTRAAERVRSVGYLTAGTSGAKYLSAAMAKVGWIEGRNVRYEVRRVERDGSDAAEGAAHLVRAAPDVLVSSGATFVLALAKATRTIPIVCGGISDPVGEGIAITLQRPGRNVTGLSYGLPEAAVLQIGMLRALLPQLKRLVTVTTVGEPIDRPTPAHEAAAAAAGISIELLKVRNMEGVERIFASMRRPEAEAAWIALLPKDAAPERLAAAAIGHRIATHVLDANLVRAGCLMSYWLTHSAAFGRVAVLVDKILRGEDPGLIPFELPDKAEFTFNRATAKALGLRVTPDILVRATEVVG